MRSKYAPLWEYLEHYYEDDYTMSFEEIEEILGFELDYSFIENQNEAKYYGYVIKEISMVDKEVKFARLYYKKRRKKKKAPIVES